MNKVGLTVLEARGSILSQAEHIVLGVLERIFLLRAELGAPSVRNHFEEDRYNPCAETASNGNSPVLTGKAILADLQGIGSKLNDDGLSTGNADPHHDEHPVGVNATEDIKVVIDHAAVDEVEDLHDSEHIEDVCHLARGALILGVLAP